MWDSRYMEELNAKRQQALQGGGAARVEKQHKSGKLTARERLNILFDPGTFVEVDNLMELRSDNFGLQKKKVPGDGVVTGYGLVNGRKVFAYAEDFTVIGGSLGEIHAQKICRVMDMAIESRRPFVGINDSGGARIEEGIDSLNGYAGMFLRHTKASGMIPQIAVILGPCAGGACYSPGLCDFIFMSEDVSRMFITGPAVIKEVTHEEVSSYDLGSARVHMEKSGVCHFAYKGDKEVLMGVRQLLSYLPDNCDSRMAPVKGKSVDTTRKIPEIVPDNQRRIYDVRDVINTFVDKGTFFEVQRDFARNIVVGFARLEGRTIGLVANNPQVYGGSLDCDGSDKAARFVRVCDAFNIPLVSLVDIPGFFPGKAQEQSGIIRHGAKMLYAFSEATVPKVCLIMRKAFGGGYIAMNSKGIGADIVYAWPIAQIAVMGADGAVNIIFKKQMEAAEDPAAERERLIEEYEAKFMSPYAAAARGYVDEVIAPDETKRKLVTALEILKHKKAIPVRRKHANIPL